MTRSNQIPWLLPPVIAHRGASTVAPENTMSALLKAIELGATYIESDVVLAKTGEAVMFHDDDLKRTTNGSGLIEQMPIDALQSLDAGSWFDDCFADARIPLLSEWVQCAALHKVGLNIEIKRTERVSQVVEATLAVLDSEWSTDLPSILISSKSSRVLQAVHQQAPAQYGLGLISGQWNPSLLQALKACHCVSLHVNYHLLTPGRIQTVLDAGYQLLAYTVNDSALAMRLLDLGVASVFSDHVPLLPGPH